MEQEPTRCWITLQRTDPESMTTANVLTILFENGRFWIRGEEKRLKEKIETQLQLTSGQEMDYQKAHAILTMLTEQYRGQVLSASEIVCR